MNKRARTRLIGVTVIVLALVGVILYTTMQSSGAYSKTVDEVLKDAALVGERVKVSGSVVPGSWDKGSNPMKFAIQAENGGGGGVINVVYTGSAPSTFGDGVVAIVTGTLKPGGTIESTDMITKCPSKYESAKGAMPVSSLVLGDPIQGVTVTGFVKPGSVGAPGSGTAFVLAEKADGSGKTVAVAYSGGLPNTVKDGTQLVVKGDYGSDGTLAASSVALEASEK